MKRTVAVMAALAVLAGAWLVAQNAAAPKPLAEIVPAGAMVYLEAKSLSTLLADWNGSGEKKSWLAGENYQVFSRSRLYLRLQQVFEEYANGVGVPPNMELVNSVAGGESALAIYDINKLDFLYVTRLASARAMQSALWKVKEKFTARNAAGSAYFVKTDPVSKRTAGFAVVGDLLLVSTREEALTGALALVSGANAVAVRREPWFVAATGATGAAGELRMVMNMEKLAVAPAFRSYWVQRNAGEMRQYSAGINDLTRGAAEYREQRVLLRNEPAAVGDPKDVGEVLRYAAAGGLYRAWAQPEASFAASLLAAKVLSPGRQFSGSGPRNAPQVTIEAGEIGEEADLETRMDQAPYEPAGSIYKAEPVTRLLTANRPGALLHVQSGRVAADGVFVTNDAAVLIMGAQEWNVTEVRAAIEQAVEGLHTVSKLGVGWKQRRAGSDAVEEMDGLAGVAFSIRGRLLLVANRGAFVDAVWKQQGQPQTAATYASGYRTAELAPYVKMMRLIEAPGMSGNENEPSLFAANLPSLVRALGRVKEVAITANDDGRQVKQSVVYRLGR